MPTVSSLVLCIQRRPSQSQAQKHFCHSWKEISFLLPGWKYHPTYKLVISPNKKCSNPEVRQLKCLPHKQSQQIIIKTIFPPQSSSWWQTKASGTAARWPQHPHGVRGLSGVPRCCGLAERTIFHLSHHLEAGGETQVDTTGKRNQLSKKADG